MIHGGRRWGWSSIESERPQIGAWGRRAQGLELHRVREAAAEWYEALREPRKGFRKSSEERRSVGQKSPEAKRKRKM
jgi:hypothetical protein